MTSEELGVKLQNVTIESLGKAKRVVSDREKTTIIGGGGAKEAIEARCNEIRKQIQTTTSELSEPQRWIKCRNSKGRPYVLADNL